MERFINGKWGLTLVQMLMERSVSAYLLDSGLSLGSGEIYPFFLGILWGFRCHPFLSLPIRHAGKAQEG